MPQVTLWWTARRQSSTHWISTGWSSGPSYLPPESPQHTKWAEAGSYKYPTAPLQRPLRWLANHSPGSFAPKLQDGSPAVSGGRWRELAFPPLPWRVMLFCIPKGPVLSDSDPFVWGEKGPEESTQQGPFLSNPDGAAEIYTGITPAFGNQHCIYIWSNCPLDIFFNKVFGHASWATPCTQDGIYFTHVVRSWALIQERSCYTC